MECPRCRVNMRPQTMGEALIEVAVCPTCRGLWLDKGKVLHFSPTPHELAQALSRGLLAPVASSLVCPRCPGHALAEGGLLTEDIRVGQCARCGGLWLGPGMLKRLTDTQLRPSTTAPPSAAAGVSPAQSPRQASCPECGTFLSTQVMGESMVKVLTCGSCHGTWFERGDLLHFVSNPGAVAQAVLVEPKASPLLCPHCAESMTEGGLVRPELRVVLCRCCGGLWFRAGMLRSLNEALSTPAPASERAPAPVPPPEHAAARHARGATASLWARFWSFFFHLKWQYLPMLLSDYGREILRRKYDAIATDRGYEDRPSGLLGPIGRWVDRKVLDLPSHEALRQRLRLVADNLQAETREHSRPGTPKVRVLSAPCGLIRDLLVAVSDLRREAPKLAEKLELHALDLDATDEVLPMAAKRAASAGVTIRFYKDDLFNPQNLSEALKGGRRFHVVNCIGLTAWLDLPDVERLARFFHDHVLADGGTLIMDNWAATKQAALGEELGIHTRYHDPAAFVKTLERSGYRLKGRFITPNGVNTLYVATAVRE